MKPALKFFSVAAIALSMLGQASLALALTNRESICTTRRACSTRPGESACPSGFRCRADLSERTGSTCSATEGFTADALCLSDADATCLTNETCLNSAVAGSGAAPTCCTCTRPTEGGTVNADFNIPAPYTCANFNQSPDVAGSRQPSEITDAGISCTPSSACRSPQPATALYSAMTEGVANSTTGGPASPDVSTPGAPSSQRVEAVIPTLGVPIPGVVFSPPVSSAEGNSEQIFFLGQYIAGLYRYGVGIAALVAVIMVVYGGFRYLLGSVPGDYAKGKEIIQDAVVGLMLVLGGYTLLDAVNTNVLTLEPLTISTIQSQTELLRTFGSAANDEMYQAEGTNNYEISGESGGGQPSGAPSATADAQPGQYRAVLQASCGAKDGLSLPDLGARRQRLKQIVEVWKHITVDQGASFYIRGGPQNCSINSYKFMLEDAGFASHLSVMFGEFKKSSVRSRVSMTFSPACSAIISGGPLPDNCQGIRSAIPAALTTEQRRSMTPEAITLYNNLRKSFQDGYLTCQRARWRMTECQSEYDRAYVALTSYLKDTGIFCGDCANMQKAIYDCFGFNSRQIYTMVSRGGAPGCHNMPNDRRWTLPQRTTRAQIDEAVSKLRFGDLIDLGQRHVIMYTGGVGLPYEIFEMGCVGGTGTNNEGSAENKLARQIGGITYGGACTHKSAAEYIRITKPRFVDCYFAYKPLEHPDFHLPATP